MPAPQTSVDLWQSIVLGIVQGVTEFLPISSSGHLVVLQHFFGFAGNRLVFDLLVHLGTLLAVTLFFGREILDLLKRLRREASERHTGEGSRFILLVALANVPAAIVGLGFHEQAARLFDKPSLAAAMFGATGLLLLTTRRVQRLGRHGLYAVPWHAALLMGIAQAVAILPGISRSGATIAVGMLLLVRKDDAARFSFLMSIPAIGGAFLVECFHVEDGGTFFSLPYVAGFAAAFVVGLAALKVLTTVIRHNRFYLFAPYLFAMAVVTAVALVL